MMQRFQTITLTTALSLAALTQTAVAQDVTIARFEAQLTNLGLISPVASSDDPNDPTDDLIPRGVTTIATPAPTMTDPSRQIAPGTPLFSPIDTGVSGFATFDLLQSPSGEFTLAYEITLQGFDLLDPGVAVPPGTVFDEQTPGDLSNDLAAIHIHNSRLPGGLTREFAAPAPHALNLFGIPTDASNTDDFPFGGDDEDLLATQDGANVVLSGLWEDTDKVLRDFGPASTRELTGSLDALFDGQLNLLIHTFNDEAIGGAGGPAIGGQIIQVAIPEPAAACLLALGGLLAGFSRRR